MKQLFITFFLGTSFFCLSQKSDSTTIFDDIDFFLQEEVVFGLVDYANLNQYPFDLQSLVNQIAAYDLQNADQAHRTAFYINAYNILVIKQIADNYPIKSPMEVSGFFKGKEFRVAGEMLTLDAIEFTKIIDPTKDPRIHFGLGCGARSCPFLYDRAFFPDKLDQQLDFRVRVITDRTNYVYVDNEKGIVVLNKIFDWYRDQFERHSGSLISYVNTYRSQKIPSSYQVQFQEYDWSLNDR